MMHKFHNLVRTIRTFRPSVFGLVIFLSFVVLGYGWYSALAAHRQAAKPQKPALAQSSQAAPSLSVSAEDIDYVSHTPKNFEDVQRVFKEIAEKKGGRYAFELLRKAQLPAGTDLHLVGHGIGDVLYKQEGVKGIEVCNNDFRNACSHSIVVGLFTDYGEAALPKITEACKMAPGGAGAYTMCFHGLGHGVLAYYGYSMEKAVAVCNKTSTGTSRDEARQCISGAVMEIIGGGFHDRDIWKASRAKTLIAAHPLSLCQASYMPNDSKDMCYVYLTPYLWEAVGGDPFNPTPESTRKAMKLCDAIPKSEMGNRSSCYGGFGKEFDGYVQGRDIRLEAMNKMTDTQFKEIYTWCSYGETEEAISDCVEHAMSSLYWGGENDKAIAIGFCSNVPAGTSRDRCFSALIGSAFQYMPGNQSYLQSFCTALPQMYGGSCQSRLDGRGMAPQNQPVRAREFPAT